MDAGTEPDYAAVAANPEKPTTYRTYLDSHQPDPELRAIETALHVLGTLPHDTQVRAVTYIRDRIESDPAVWNTGATT